MDERTGARVRRYRLERGMSLDALATLTGLSKGFLSKVENGLRGLDERGSLLAVADALDVAPHKLTGQPYDPKSRQEDTVRAAVVEVRDVLLGSEVGQRYLDPLRDLDMARRDTARVVALHSDCLLDQYGPLLPGLLGDLFALAGDRDSGVRASALPLLVTALNATRDLTHWAGEEDLAFRASELGVAAADAAEDPALVGYATFGLVHSLGHVDGKLARVRANVVAERAADDLQAYAGDGGAAAEMYGMLHLVAAWSCLIAGEPSRVDAHLGEARQIGERTGEGRAHQLWFGPTNVAAWQLAVAVERGDGRIAELSQALDPAALPSRERQAGHWINVGRGLSQDSATARRAVPAFKRARGLAPVRTRINPFVRATTERLLGEVGGAEVTGFARWLGIIPAAR